MAIIDVQNLHYEYPQVVALNNISFQIQPATVTALVGPNGAGKTTLMNCLASLARPQRGSIMIDGIPVLEQPRQSHEIIGYLPDFYGLYEDLSVEHCLRYMGMAQNIPPDEIDTAIERAASRMEITDLMKAKAGNLSRGQGQRVAIAQAIIHNPKVLLLDEPASGLDPEARHHLSQLFVEMAKTGMTLLVSSHILAELEDYCTHVLIMRHGDVIQQDEIKSARMELATHRVLELMLSEPSSEFAKQLATLEGIKDVAIDGNIATFEFSGDNFAQQALLKRLIDLGLPVCSMSPKSLKLQEIYLKKMSEL